MGIHPKSIGPETGGHLAALLVVIPMFAMLAMLILVAAPVTIPWGAWMGWLALRNWRDDRRRRDG